MRISSRDYSTLNFRPNTPIAFYYADRAYNSGVMTAVWKRFDDNGLNTFWADWRATYGALAVQFLSLGVSDVCNIKLNYSPALYDFLQDTDVVVVKGADQTAINEDGSPNPMNPNTYRLYGNCENVREMNRLLSFKVRRLEQK